MQGPRPGPADPKAATSGDETRNKIELALIAEGMTKHECVVKCPPCARVAIKNACLMPLSVASRSEAQAATIEVSN